jgi:hypothetical protein
VVAWVLITGIEGFVGQLAIGAVAAGAADLVIMLPERPHLGALLAVLAVGFLAGVLQQMFRRPRTAVVASLAGGVLLLCLVCALSVLLLTGRAATGPALSTAAVLAVGAALVLQHVADLLLPRPRLADGVPRGLAGIVLAVVAGAVVCYLRRGDGLVGTGALPGTVAALLYGAVLGGTAALAGLAASFAAVEDPGGDAAEPMRGWVLPIVQAVLPLAVCAPVGLALQAVL